MGSSYARTVHWPGDEPIAMTIGVALEAFERFSQVRLEKSNAGRDEFSLSYGEYGFRVGVWRLLEVFETEAVHASFSVSGLLAERQPALLKTIVDAGHDIVAHGWVNDRLMADAGAEEERRVIQDAVAAITAATGTAPTGWASPGNSGSEDTPRLLLDSGITWHGDDASDDLPFVQMVGERRIAVLPKVNVDANDIIQWVIPHNAPNVFAESFCPTFDTLLEEGHRGRPKWADMVLHCHMAGRPTFIPTLRRCLAHVKAHDDVWWTRKSDLAAWTLDQGFER